MSNEVSAPAEGFAALHALIGLLSTVNPLVPREA